MITPLYAALAVLIFVVLSFRTLLLRRKLGIGMGTGGDKSMERAIGVHANFAEYAPIALVLIYFLETRIGTGLLIHLLCIALIVGRLLHAYGVSQMKEDFRFRVSGMVLTLGCLISASGRIIASYWL
ncbi:MAG: MAPEG family protein [Pseudomonadota bacterium]